MEPHFGYSHTTQCNISVQGVTCIMSSELKVLSPDVATKVLCMTSYWKALIKTLHVVCMEG